MGQLLVEGGEPERNVARAVTMIGQAAREGCAVVVLPETLDLGWTHPSALDMAEPIPGPRSALLRDAAVEHRIYVCAGLTERDGDQVYNAGVLISPDGEILLKYRKINVLECAFPYYAIGGSLGVVQTPLGCIGMSICSDNYSNSLEIGHTLGRMGARIILSPSSWTVDYSEQNAADPYSDKWLAPYRSLAEVHELVIVSTTSVGYIVGGPYEGKKMVGCSLAVGPEGLIAKGSYNEVAGELIVTDVPLLEAKRKGTQIGDFMTSRKEVGA